MSYAQSCLTLCNPMDYSLPGSSVHGIFPERVQEWVAISSSKESPWHRYQTHISCIVGGFYHWASQFSSVTQSCPTLCDPMNCSTPGLPVHHQLLELTQTHVHWVGDTIQPFHPLLSPSPPAPNPTQQQGLSQWVSSSHQESKYWSFASTSVLPMNTQDWCLGWTGWISLKSKGLKSLLQYHSSNASIIWHSAFFIIQLSHPHMTTGKTIALTIWTFVLK